MVTTTFVSNLLEHAGVAVESIESIETEGGELIKIRVTDDEAGQLIGKQAETLQAFQRIVRVAKYVQDNTEKRITLDVNDYRQQKKEKALEILAEVAEKVLETGRAYTITYPLTPSERFVVHTEVGENEKYSSLMSYSEGDGRFRRIVIAPKGAKTHSNSTPMEQEGGEIDLKNEVESAVEIGTASDVEPDSESASEDKTQE